MKTAWEMGEPHIRVLEGGRDGLEYRLSYPQTGVPGVDRFWREHMTALRAQLLRERLSLPLRVRGEWQETRRDAAVFSGFTDVYRTVGYADERMERLSATFFPGGRRPAALGELFLPGGARRLMPILREKVQELAGTGESFFAPAFLSRPMMFVRPQRFYLTGEGLAIWFPQEHVAPRACGIPTLFFPYDEIKDVLRPSFPD